MAAGSRRSPSRSPRNGRAPLEQPIDDPRRPAPPPRDRDRGGMVDLNVEDPRRPLDDLGQLRFLVEVEAVGCPEPVPQRRRDSPGPCRRADDGERLQAEPQAPGGGPFRSSVEGVSSIAGRGSLDRAFSGDLVENRRRLLEARETAARSPGRSTAGPEGSARSPSSRAMIVEGSSCPGWRAVQRTWSDASPLARAAVSGREIRLTSRCPMYSSRLRGRSELSTTTSASCRSEAGSARRRPYPRNSTSVRPVRHLF